jgi:hypothetical protein
LTKIFPERFQSHIEADLVAVFEAIGDGFGNRAYRAS